MTKFPNTKKEYIKKAVQNYVQSAVYVDDNIYNSFNESEILGGYVDDSSVKVNTKKNENDFISPPDSPKSGNNTKETQLKQNDIERTESEREKGSKNEISKEKDNENLDDEKLDRINNDELVYGFAKHKVICSPIQPTDIDEDEQICTIKNLCVNADIIILDWAFNDGIKNPKSLIFEVIEQLDLEVPDCSKLIIIYTKETGLNGIAGNLRKFLLEKSKDKKLNWKIEKIIQDKHFRFKVNNCHFSIIGKFRPTSKTAIVRVKKSDLADEAIKEFERVVKGIMEAAVLFCLRAGALEI